MSDSNTQDLGPITVSVPWQASFDHENLKRRGKRHLEWVEGFGLWSSQKVRDDYEAADYPAFAAYTYPRALGMEQDWITDIMGLTWLFDDAFDTADVRKSPLKETTARLGILRDIVRGTTRVTRQIGSPLAAAFQDIVDRMNTILPESSRERHLMHWDRLFHGFQQEAENNINGITPTFDDFIQLRRDASGVEICWDWIGMVYHIELPASVYSDALYQEMIRDANDVVVWKNDLFSARREWNDGNTDNLVPVLVQRERCSWREANTIAHKMIADKIESFQLLEKKFYESACYTTLAPPDQANTISLINSIKVWIAGSLAWHYACPRYK
jgi:hypothetical protein